VSLTERIGTFRTALISLDSHQVIKPALPLDQLSCFVLRVSCVSGDHNRLTAGYVHAVEKMLDLSDLIGSVRYSDLGNRDRFTSQYCNYRNRQNKDQLMLPPSRAARIRQTPQHLNQTGDACLSAVIRGVRI